MNSVAIKRSSIEIKSIDSDWNSPEALKVHYVIFKPGTTNDVLVMKEGSDTGPVALEMKSTDGEPRIVYLDGQTVDLYLDYSECTLNTGAKVLIMLWTYK